MLRKFITGILVGIMCFSTAMPTFAATAELQSSENQIIVPQTVYDRSQRAGAPTTYYELQNVKHGKIVGRGGWQVGPKATGDTGGAIYQQIKDKFEVQIDGKLGVSSDIFQATFQFKINQSRTLAAICRANVPKGKTVQIYYRPLCQAYTADQVLYRIGPGVPKQEVSRSKITVYDPVNIEFKW